MFRLALIASSIIIPGTLKTDIQWVGERTMALTTSMDSRSQMIGLPVAIQELQKAAAAACKEKGFGAPKAVERADATLLKPLTGSKLRVRVEGVYVCG